MLNKYSVTFNYTILVSLRKLSFLEEMHFYILIRMDGIGIRVPDEVNLWHAASCRLCVILDAAIDSCYIQVRLIL